MVGSTGQHEKMLLQAFSQPELGEANLIDSMRVLINPENYSQEYKIEYNEEQGEGASASPQPFSSMPPLEMSFQFLFDRTGIMPESPQAERGVMEDIDKLKRLCYDYNGDIHRPNYLSITWGQLNFKCVLLSLNVQYKLFKPDGTPLRAVVQASFKEYKDEQQRSLEENNSSPDLTHLRQVVAGDTLPLMAYRIYRDPAYYLEVARANGLVNFRNLAPGQELFFPPLEK